MSSGIGQMIDELSAALRSDASSSPRLAASHQSFLSRPKPNRLTSIERITFCRLSLKVRPMPIASPTDFICVVRVSSASGNFSNVQRGILVTT